MTSPLQLLSSALLLLGAGHVSRQPSPGAARRRAILWATSAWALESAAIALPHLFRGAIPAGFAWLAPEASAELSMVTWVHQFLAVVIVSVAPLRTHGPAALGATLRILGLGSAFLLFDHPLALTLLWALVTAAMADALHAQPAARRIFLAYQGPSVALFAIGTALHQLGHVEAGIYCWLAASVLREAVVPFHSWLLRVVEDAPVGVTCAFVAPQLGVYAHLALVHNTLPGDSGLILGGVAAVSALAAALLSLVQPEVMRAVAYLIVSQTSLVAFGLTNGHAAGHRGAVLTWAVLALAMSCLLLALDSLAGRRGPLRVTGSGGAPRQLPYLGAIVLLFGLMLVGLPLSAGFVAEDLLVQGSVADHPYLAFALIGVTGINATQVMRLYFALFAAGPERPGEFDINGRQRLVFSLALALLIGTGVAPALVLGHAGHALAGSSSLVPMRSSALPLPPDAPGGPPSGVALPPHAAMDDAAKPTRQTAGVAPADSCAPTGATGNNTRSYKPTRKEKEMGEVVSPSSALQSLLEGNASYLAGGRRAARPAPTADQVEREVPIAALVTCSDLGVPPEQLFDLPMGKLYITQTAAEVVGDSEVASVAFNARQGGVKLVVVMGHTPCPVIRHCRASDGQGCEHLSRQLEISGEGLGARPPTTGPAADAALSRQHAIRMAARLRTRLGGDTELSVVAAHLDALTGKVEFL